MMMNQNLLLYLILAMNNYVMFCDGTHAFKKLLKPGFGHCYVIKEFKKNQWVVLDPTPTHLNVRPITTQKFLPWYFKSTKGHEWIQVNQEADNKEKMRGRNCVTAVKYIIGLHQPWIITPWQLYQFLKNKGDCDEWRFWNRINDEQL